jgi:hypothetical protein
MKKLFLCALTLFSMSHCMQLPTKIYNIKATEELQNALDNHRTMNYSQFISSISRWINAGADPNTFAGISILEAAVKCPDEPDLWDEKDNPDFLKSLLDRGASPNLKASALHLACASHRYNKAKTLIENGADINARRRDGNTPLITCLNNWNIKTARLLLERGAELHHTNKQGQTAETIAKTYAKLSDNQEFLQLFEEKLASIKKK